MNFKSEIEHDCAAFKDFPRNDGAFRKSGFSGKETERPAGSYLGYGASLHSLHSIKENDTSIFRSRPYFFH